MNATRQSAEPDIKDGTAEELLIMPTDYKGLPSDAINAALLRANAVLLLLQVQVEADGNVERLSRDILSTAIWAVQGELGLIGKMIENVE